MTAAPEPMWTDIAQAWGTVAGAAFGFLAVVVTGWLLMHEIRKRTAEERDAEAAQARLIIGQLSLDAADEGSHIRSVRWRVDNFSEKPIRGVIVSITRDDHLEDLFSKVNTKAIPPGSHIEDRWSPRPPVQWGNGGPRSVPPMHHLHLHVEFMDANGLIWTATDGNLPQRILLTPTIRAWQKPKPDIYVLMRARQALSGRDDAGRKKKI